MHQQRHMKRLLVLLVAALCITVGGDGYAQPRHHHSARPKRVVRRNDVALSPLLLRRLQRNLVEGGYFRGPSDGRLGPRTRRALAEFQREYHLRPTGTLDRATADALLGRDVVGAWSLASAKR
jgi:peptidoglycan hydrolase-like protein with peptidoglycan-binding domain